MPRKARKKSMDSGVAGLIDRVAASGAIRKKLNAIRKGKPVVFDHVVPSARGFLAAVIARATGLRTWLVAANLKEQERLHLDLLTWAEQVIFVPELERAPVEGALPDPEITAERLAAVSSIAEEVRGGIVLTTVEGLEQEAPAPALFDRLQVIIRRGERLERETLVERLVQSGYEVVNQIGLRGQIAVRGGIMDVFSWQHGTPVRLEFFGDEVESIREFDLDQQTSVKQVEQCAILAANVEDVKTCRLVELKRDDDLLVDMSSVLEAPAIQMREEDEGLEEFAGAFFRPEFGEHRDWVLQEATRGHFIRQMERWSKEGWQIHLFFQNEGEKARFDEITEEFSINAENICHHFGLLTEGFTFPEEKIAVVVDAEIFGRYHNQSIRSRSLGGRGKFLSARQQIDFSELAEGDLVVHLEHGIGRFEGLRKIPSSDDQSHEVMVIEFAEEAKLYVPLDQAHLVSRYVGIGKRAPALSSLGDSLWASAKRQAERSILDYAAKLLEVHAVRQIRHGHSFAPDSKWQQEFEAAFLYKETPDQLRAIEDAKDDMESFRPMDRLICGDVGFGKTEVAIRAAFKAVMDGKQVAILVPTTVLAQQHFLTFRERMADYPVVIEMLSRFRSASEQREVVERVREGGVDIVIGTHRLISADVEFKNLGLVVVDEEQRFGVKHKEKLKQRFALVDMLTLSATPIPRTLYLALTGAKDMSVIETPPPNRIPVETMICPYDERIIRDAVNRELQRQGQVYFLHNRIDTIFRTAARIEALCPKARVVVGHGQMDEHELENVMRRFVEGEADVLVSTTIIESGLDIPNANTIIIDRADRFGLADLYQLRGRVGRSNHKAYAYLLLPRELLSTREARQRVNAIKQYSTLGAGFKVAMRDLEIRGAGNILGTAQSGHITAVGFELYCQLLKQAVAKLKGEKVRARVEVDVRLDFVATREADFVRGEGQLPAFLPGSFIGDAAMRIKAYRQLAELTGKEELEALATSWRDRFGRLPEAVQNLLLLTEIKLAAAEKRITRIDVEEGKVKITKGGDFVLVNGKFPRLTSGESLPNFREVLTLVKNL